MGYHVARSSHARRLGTGRRTHATKFRRTKVIHHRHRRYAGIRGSAARGDQPRKIRLNKTGKHHRFFGRKKHVGPRRKPGTAPVYVPKGRHGHRKFKGRHYKGRKKVTMRKGLHRKFKGRKKVTMRKGLHRKFKGRKKVTMRKGLHRKFKGRRKSTHKRAYHGRRKKAGTSAQTTRAGSVISSQSYISMFS